MKGISSMETTLKWFLVLVVLLSAQFGSHNSQVCLTWNVTEDHLFLECNVLNLENELLLEDEFARRRGRCFKHKTISCVTSDQSDKIFHNFSDSGFSLVLKTVKDKADGNWKCVHGLQEANVDIVLLKGTVYSANINLSGEITETKESFMFKLTCFSCWIPVMKSVHFFVNDVLVDNVRHTEDGCYHKRKMCSLTECFCSSKGNNYTWSYISNKTYLKFSCEMRFKDLKTSLLSFQRANLIFNNTGFTTEFKRDIRTISITDQDIYLSSGDPDANDMWSAPKSMAASYILLLIVTICSILFGLCTRKDRIQSFASRCCPEREAGSVGKQFEEKKYCSTCMFASVSAICIDCQKSYCDFCFINHMQTNPDHRICQKQLSTRTQQKTICGKCKELAAKLCKKCSKVRCLSCYHRHNEMVRIYPLPTVSKTQTTEKSKYTINKINNGKPFFFQKDESPVRIYGIGYLADGTLFALDGSNLKLIVFNSKNEQLTEAFQDEPCAITSMSGNQVAVTFPYNRRIRIYEIDVEGKTLMTEVKYITMEDLEVPKLKPYSITYNQNHFAIEVGEREDGIIIIYDNAKSEGLHKIKCEIAYFTGHTIRLALDMSEKLLFISAMGKRMVYCMDFNRNLKWDITNASPRSIIILENSPFGNIVILSSRRCNAIYVLKKDSGEEICHHRISSPRYTAYNSKENKLCVHLKSNTNENVKHEEDALIFLEFQIIQPEECNVNSETKLLNCLDCVEK